MQALMPVSPETSAIEIGDGRARAGNDGRLEVTATVAAVVDPGRVAGQRAEQILDGGHPQSLLLAGFSIDQWTPCL